MIGVGLDLIQVLVRGQTGIVAVEESITTEAGEEITTEAGDPITTE